LGQNAARKELGAVHIPGSVKGHFLWGFWGVGLSLSYVSEGKRGGFDYKKKKGVGGKDGPPIEAGGSRGGTKRQSLSLTREGTIEAGHDRYPGKSRKGLYLGWPIKGISGDQSKGRPNMTWRDLQSWGEVKGIDSSGKEKEQTGRKGGQGLREKMKDAKQGRKEI